MADRPRIRDVAAKAGTSVSTVSNLLNGRPDRMRPETVQRIEEAIAELGHFAELVGGGLSVVAFDIVASRDGGEIAIDTVSMDNRAAGYLATRHLAELGHTRIGYISGATPTVSRRERLEGYRRALVEA